MNKILPLIRYMNWSPRLPAMGCSFGGYHAMNFALKHPDVFTDCVSLSGAFDIRNFSDGHYDNDDDWYLGRYRANRYILAAGDWDICLGSNQRFDAIMNAKGIPHRLDIRGHSRSMAGRFGTG